MSAHNKNFPWMSYYGNYIFFEQRMHEHTKINSLDYINSSLYHIKLTSRKELRVFICECYSFDIAEYIESYENFGPLDAVVINSNWCSYSLDVKRHCMGEQVGVFDIAGFMAAIHMDEYWNYLTEHERECFQKNGWL